jgi:hypothetical protein
MSRKQRNRAVARASEVNAEAFDVMIEHMELVGTLSLMNDASVYAYRTRDFHAFFVSIPFLPFSIRHPQRRSKRLGWAERAADRIYKQGDREERPMNPPFAFGGAFVRTRSPDCGDGTGTHAVPPSPPASPVYGSPLPENLTPVLEDLRSWRQIFLARPLHNQAH